MGSLRTDTWEKLLEQMEEAGVGFYLNGRRATPKDIIDKCSLREKAVYMPDFVMDDEGRLKEVRYDEVTNGKRMYAGRNALAKAWKYRCLKEKDPGSPKRDPIPAACRVFFKRGKGIWKFIPPASYDSSFRFDKRKNSALPSGSIFLKGWPAFRAVSGKDALFLYVSVNGQKKRQIVSSPEFLPHGICPFNN